MVCMVCRCARLVPGGHGDDDSSPALLTSCNGEELLSVWRLPIASEPADVTECKQHHTECAVVHTDAVSDCYVCLCLPSVLTGDEVESVTVPAASSLAGTLPACGAVVSSLGTSSDGTVVVGGDTTGALHFWHRPASSSKASKAASTGGGGGAAAGTTSRMAMYDPL